MDQSRIRNFCIISHVDHGKSTLADRFLEITGTIEKRKMREQVLDQMDLERERGITIKLQPVRMIYHPKMQNDTRCHPEVGVPQKSQSDFKGVPEGEARRILRGSFTSSRMTAEPSIFNFSAWGGSAFGGDFYILNLIDTPGHVDFTYEVSRSLLACEGAILVVDATQGIQAQTLANVHLALENHLAIIPVVNKIDLPNAEPEETAQEIKEAFGFPADEILFVSAKTGENTQTVLEAVVKRIPPPRGVCDGALQALIFDSKYDKHRGVVAYVRIKDGRISANEPLRLMGANITGQALEVGYFSPELEKTNTLVAGEIGYIVTGLREVAKARVGDTITSGMNPALTPLPGYKEIKPTVFASVFPASGDDYSSLRDAMEKLKLNDASLSFEQEHLPALGFGFRTGFLGLLHMDIVQERLSREYGLDLVLTTPSVAYEVKKRDGKELRIYSPAELPDLAEVEKILEPWVKLDLVTPEKFLGGIMQLVTSRRGIYQSTDYLGPGRLNLHFEIPLANIISDFYDKLKSVSSGFASMNYEFLDYREGDLVKVEILVAGEKVEPLSLIVHRDIAESEGRRIVEKLKTLLPRQQFAVALQAAIGGKIIARETIPALRKDVTSKLYGGDVTRKMKLLQKQKKGKKRLKTLGKVEIPQAAFLAIMKR